MTEFERLDNRAVVDPLFITVRRGNTLHFSTALTEALDLHYKDWMLVYRNGPLVRIAKCKRGEEGDARVGKNGIEGGFTLFHRHLVHKLNLGRETYRFTARLIVHEGRKACEFTTRKQCSP